MLVSTTRRTVTGGLLMALGIGFSLWGARLPSRARAVASWPSAAGTVVRSGVEEAADATDRTTMYQARVEYQYSVAGQTYTGSRISFADYSSSSRSEMQDIAARYVEGAPVTVYYDASDPGVAMLDARVPFVTWTPLLLGAVAVVAGALVVFAKRRNRSCVVIAVVSLSQFVVVATAPVPAS